MTWEGNRRGEGEEEASRAVSGAGRVADVGPEERARLRERVPVAAVAARARRQCGGGLALVGPGPLRHRERHAAGAVLVREHVEELLGLTLTDAAIAAVGRRAPLADEDRYLRAVVLDALQQRAVGTGVEVERVHDVVWLGDWILRREVNVLGPRRRAGDDDGFRVDRSDRPNNT